MHNARAQLAFRDFQQNSVKKDENVTKFRASYFDENRRRWKTFDFDDAELRPEELRFQAYVGREVVFVDMYSMKEIEPILEKEEIAALMEPLEFQKTQFVAPPAAPMRPINDQETFGDVVRVLHDRIEADGRRIQESHNQILKLAASAAASHSGAAGPLIKLIDQLASALTQHHSSTTESLTQQLVDLQKREETVLAAEAVAETKLIEAEAKDAESQNEGAIIGALMQHLGPQILEQVSNKMSGGVADVTQEDG